MANRSRCFLQGGSWFSARLLLCPIYSIAASFSYSSHAVSLMPQYRKCCVRASSLHIPPPCPGLA